MTDKKAKSPDPIRELTQTSAEAMRLGRMAKSFLDKQALLWLNVDDLKRQLRGRKITIRLTSDGADTPRVDLCENSLCAGAPVKKGLMLEDGTVITGKLETRQGIHKNTFVLSECQGPPATMGKYRGWDCEIKPGFIVSINGIQFDLGAWR